MKLIHSVGWLAALAVGASWALTGPVGQFIPKPVAPVVAAEVASPYVKIIGDSGSGSGVHLGHGYILTATHVATMNKDGLTAKDALGRSHKLTLLWANAVYDIALMKLDDGASLAAAQLSCDAPVVGTHVRAYGNPMTIENVFTSGTIVGAPMTEGPWKSIMTLDLTIVPGMSGGALVNDAGQVVGIDVGVMVYGALTGFGYAVPSSIACDLLARS